MYIEVSYKCLYCLQNLNLRNTTSIPQKKVTLSGFISLDVLDKFEVNFFLTLNINIFKII